MRRRVQLGVLVGLVLLAGGLEATAASPNLSGKWHCHGSECEGSAPWLITDKGSRKEGWMAVFAHPLATPSGQVVVRFNVRLETDWITKDEQGIVFEGTAPDVTFAGEAGKCVLSNLMIKGGGLLVNKKTWRVHCRWAETESCKGSMKQNLETSCEGVWERE